MQIEIDSESGFCFGVTTAIKKAEEELTAHSSQKPFFVHCPDCKSAVAPPTLYCLGDIVHNGMECERLRQMGLITINHEQMKQLHNVKVLLRAHGEPPETYELARRNNIEIIDATCPVVLKLQKRIRENYETTGSPKIPSAPSSSEATSSPSPHPQIVIFGKRGHAEVLGLVGQTEGTAIVIENFDEVKKLDFSRDICLYSQTTKSLDEFHRIIDYIQTHIAPTATFRSFDTICRSVTNRMTGISQFAARHDLILFVCGRKSSNGKVLFNECSRVNPNSHLIEGPEEIDRQWLQGIETVGICGATSTPKWLMEQCRKSLLLSLLFLLSFFATPAAAQRPHYDKLSPMLRQLTRQEVSSHRVRRVSVGNRHRSPSFSVGNSPEVCAFVKVAPGGEDVLAANGCRLLAQEGDICIANIPLNRLAALSLDSRILRIEANQHNQVQSDSMAWYLNALPVYDGLGLPQAYTGRGVIVGVMDIGFDLTHPNFYSRDTTEYRIQRFWDMLSADTVGSQLPVGRDYVGRDELLAVAHARDGLNQTHGTHTLGIAAGSGYDSPYIGMAPESDICIVANAVTEDTIYVSPDDYYKYTFATDALGFKYIFDYAESRGLPCVINFSEGSQQDFWGNDLLYYEMLQRMTGPGRIIVSSAGNNGGDKVWFRKEPGREVAGTFYTYGGQNAIFTIKGDRDFDLRFVAYGSNGNDTLLVNTSFIAEQEDSVLNAQLRTKEDTLKVLIEAYPSCYIEGEGCYDITISGRKNVGYAPRLSVEVIGTEADIEFYRVKGNLTPNKLNPALSEGEYSHSVLSPATAPCVICVGATCYRKSIINYKGEEKTLNLGDYGEKVLFSAIGPTFDGRIKPDVMAPGVNVISSYSSYYLENHPDAGDIEGDVAHFDFNGRTYAWNTNTGTSMSSPAVAGAIALWLQACPTLTTEQVFDVFEHTCRHYDESLTFPNNHYGYGEIDVYRGLLYLLGADKIDDISTSMTKASVAFTIDNSGSSCRLTIESPELLSAPAVVRIFSLSGRQVFSATLPAGVKSHSLILPSLSESVYALQIDGPQTIAGSQLITAKLR